MVLIQLHKPFVGLLELPLHRPICMDLIMDGLRISPNRLSSKHNLPIMTVYKRSPSYESPLLAAADRLGPYLIVANRWAGRSAPFPLLQLLRSGLSQSLGELTLQLKEIKQIRFKE